MSKFRKYAVEADNVAKAAMKAYEGAQERLKKAEAMRAQYPPKSITNSEYELARAKAEAAYLEAKEAMKAAQRVMEEGKAQLQAIRRELAQAVENAFAARPEDVDPATTELLKSGIMRPSEYARLYNSANTPTMRRIIAQAAHDRAEADQNMKPDERATLHAVADAGANANGGEYLQLFDVIEDCFDRCVSNPHMHYAWDEVCKPVVDNF